MITLENRHIKVTLEPEFGAQILSIKEPNSSANALAHYDTWRSPPRARDGHRYGDNTTEWLSNYRGGWQELFPNSGAESAAHGGVTTPLHGEVSTSRWDVLAKNPTTCTLRVGARIPLTLTRTMTLAPDSATLLINETVYNDGPEPLEYIWGHHPAFPSMAGSRIDLPPCKVAVEHPSPGCAVSREGDWPLVSGTHDFVDLSLVTADVQNRLTYQHSLAAGWAAYRPPASANQPGIAMAWDIETWPALWIWTLSGTAEFPWFGRARIVGMEPNRSWPSDGLDGARTRGQQLRLEPGQSHDAWLTVRLVTDNLDTPIRGVDRSGSIDIMEFHDQERTER